MAGNARRLVYFATAVSALGGFLFGYDIGVISGAILFIKREFALIQGIEEVGVSSVLLGSLLGPLVGGPWGLVNFVNRYASAGKAPQTMMVVGGMPVGVGRLAMLTGYMSPDERRRAAASSTFATDPARVARLRSISREQRERRVHVVVVPRGYSRSGP